MTDEFTIGRQHDFDNLLEQDKMFIKTYEQEDLPPHNHEFFELAYITGGATRHTLSGSSAPLARGNYFIVDYGSKHSYSQSKDLTLINCLFLPEMIDDTLAGCRSFGDLIHVCLLRYYKLYSVRNSANRIFCDDGGRVLDIITVMRRELREKNVGYQEILKNRLLEIIIITMRNMMDRSQKDAKTDVTLNMMAYIHSHYREHRLLAAYCETCHYSAPYVSRKFKQETGFTVVEYLQKTRIEKSCELLAGSRLPVSAVAEAVGYGDVKSFNALFRKLIRQSPRDYRKSAAL